ADEASFRCFAASKAGRVVPLVQRARSAAGGDNCGRRYRHGQGLERKSDGSDRQDAQITFCADSNNRTRGAMLTWLADLSHLFSPLNIFRYITFRMGGATATALLFVFFF